MGVALAEVIAALEAAYPRRLAESWDTGIGLTCGDPNDTVDRVLLAVDVDPVTVTEARQRGAGLLVTHHPLLFRPVQTVAASTAKGALVHRLIRSGIAHFAAHTNADRAVGGVNDALAEALGLRDTAPLVPASAPPLDKIVVFVPESDVDAMVTALAAAGAGTVGDYAEAAFVTRGEGRFTPMPGSHPTVGAVGTPERVAEARVEMVAPPSRRAEVVASLRAAHPYEEPAFDVIALTAVAPVGGTREGLGRVGALPAPLRLAEFVARVVAALPTTAHGVRASGDPDRMVSRVAVCGGSGSSELAEARAAGADAYVTSDVTHHTAQEHDTAAGPALLEVAHWAGEWPWLPRAARVLTDTFGERLDVSVSTLRTDAWTMHVPGDGKLA